MFGFVKQLRGGSQIIIGLQEQSGAGAEPSGQIKSSAQKTGGSVARVGAISWSIVASWEFVESPGF